MLAACTPAGGGRQTPADGGRADTSDPGGPRTGGHPGGGGQADTPPGATL